MRAKGEVCRVRVRKFNSGNIQYNHSIETHITTIPQYYTTSIPKPHSSVSYGITYPVCQQNSAAQQQTARYRKSMVCFTLSRIPLSSPASRHSQENDARHMDNGIRVAYFEN